MSKEYISDDAELMKEWDYSENEKIGLYPQNITRGSEKKANWICSQGHRFLARVDHRCREGSGCPYCSGRLPIVGENDLFSTHPHLKEEWDFELNSNIDPLKCKAGTNKKAHWICRQCGNKFSQDISKRSCYNCGCPECSKKKRAITQRMNHLATTQSLAQSHPQIAAEMIYDENRPDITPDKVTSKSNLVAKWQCSVCKYVYDARICDRVNYKNNCPACAGKVVFKGYNDFETLFPEIAKEWHPTKNGQRRPDQYTKGSDEYAWWICPLGHEYKTTINSRASGKGCPICSGHQVLKGFNDLESQYPEIAKEFHPYKNGEETPDSIHKGSNKEYYWICEQGHEWKAPVSSRTQGYGCNVCAIKRRGESRRLRAVSENGSLAENLPELAAEWHPTLNGTNTPDMFTIKSNAIVWWMCRNGHEWQAPIYSRTAGNGCPKCNFHLSTSFPEQAIFFYLSKVTTAESRFTIQKTEIDVYLPELKVGIEYNGRYYHSTRKKQDADKRKKCLEMGIRLITVNEGEEEYEDEDVLGYKYVNADYINLKETILRIADMLNLKHPDIDIARDRSVIKSGYTFSPVKNSVAEKCPRALELWDYEKNADLSPYQISFYSETKVWWKCPKCNNGWDSVPYSIKKVKCPICSNRRTIPGVNDLETRYPEIAKEWDYEKNDLLPSMVSPHSHKKAYWICSKGHSWYTAISVRTRGCGCRYCAGKK